MLTYKLHNIIQLYGVSASLFLQNIGLTIVLSIHPLTSLTRQNSDRVPHFIGACEYMYGQYLGLCLPTTQLLTPIRMCWFLSLQVKGPPKSPYKKRVVNIISWISIRISIETKCCMCCRQNVQLEDNYYFKKKRRWGQRVVGRL